MEDKLGENIDEGADKVRDLKQELKDTLFATRDIAQEAKEIATAMGMGSIEAAAFRKAFKDTASVSQDLIDNAEKLLEGTIGVKDIQKEIEKNDRSQLGLKRELSLQLDKAAIAATNLTAAQQDEIRGASTQAEIQDVLFKYHRDISSEMATALNLGQEQLGNNTKNNKELNLQLDKSKKIRDTVGLSGKLLEGISKIPIIGQLIDSEEAITKMNKAVAGGAGPLKAMMVGLKSATEDLVEAALNPLTIAIALLKAGLAFDKQLTDLQKGMGVSREEATGLRNEMSVAAAKSGDMAINSERMLKTFSMLQGQLGVAASFSTQMTEDATVLSEKVGLSDKATANFAKSSIVVGKSIDEQYKGSLGIVSSIRAATGVAIPFKETLEKAANVGGQIRAQMGGSLEEITKAVATASALGMELEQVAKSGEGMLNFQSSIESELEAELLTGKELNLEKARLLALTGDYEGLAKEISKEAGNFTEFSKMNVLQQNALAKSFNMSSNEMSDMLMNQEMMGKSAEQLRAEGKNDLADRMEARNVEEQMADAVMKLKGVFVDLVGGPVGAFLNLLTLALEPIGYILESMGKIAGLFSGSTESLTGMNLLVGAIGAGVAAYFVTVKAIALIEKGRVALKTISNIKDTVAIGLAKTRNLIEKKGLIKGIGSAIMAAVKSFGAIPVIGVGLGLAAAATVGIMGAKYLNKAEKGGMIGGNRHSQGGTVIEAEQGEFIMSRQGVQNVGVGNLYAMNKGGGISGGKAQAGGEVSSNSGMDMSGFTDAVLNAVKAPGVVVASPYGLNDANYQSRNENFKTRFE